MEPFVHLHIHTAFSLLGGTCKLDALMRQLNAYGQTAAAITDAGTMYGVIPFYQAAKQYGIHPIIGCEIYTCNHLISTDRNPPHMTLLCENDTGYRNLLKLVSKANMECFHGKPRIDLESLKQHHAGLIALSGCRKSEISRLLLNDEYAAAKAIALRYAALFGKEQFFLEVQSHDAPEDLRLMQDMIRLSEETGIPLAASNDVHYVSQEDAAAYQLLCCIRNGTALQDAPSESDRWLCSTEEMNRRFARCPQALRNTADIAARCHVDIPFGITQLPAYSPQNGMDPITFFHHLCEAGMLRHYGSHPDTIVLERLQHEYDVIERMGFTDYYLIVWDFVQYAKSHDIPVGPGRGSGAGSLCAYCMGITEIDPIENGLLFERFLNPERISMPDFDIDFGIEGRQSVIDYVTRHYGADHVSQIAAFDTLKAKAAIRDTGRAMNLPLALTDQVARLIPQQLDMTIQQAWSSSPELQQLAAQKTEVQRMLELARKIEGLPRHLTVHAAGVVIAASPLMEQVPLQQNREGVVTQYPAPVLEQLGLLKIDFLGLRNLSVIRDAERMIQQHEPQFAISAIPTDDPAVYDMLSKGDSIGVFQMESDGLRRLLLQMKPTQLSDLIALISLYRPGPMDAIPQFLAARADPAKVHYDHPRLEPILRETFGCIIYQEQVMEICRSLAGYSYGRADLVRRAMAKKKHNVMEQERSVFLYGNEHCCGAIANGVSLQTANAIFDRMVTFASYAFNKSHAAAYATIAYQTAFLKCRYPKEYFASLMSSVMGNTDKLTEYLLLATEHGIPVLPPHVNHSAEGFTTEPDGIRFGLEAIRGLGSASIRNLMTERREHGSYRSLQDFCERNPVSDIGKRGVEGLIRAGALDKLGLNRRQMLGIYEQLLDAHQSSRRNTLNGQLSLFDAEEQRAVSSIQPLQVPEYPEQELLQMEKAVTGIFLSGHPLAKWSAQRAFLHLPTIAELPTITPNVAITLLAMVSNIRLHTTKKGSKMCYLTIEDFTGTAECLIFPSLLPKVQSFLKEDAILWLNVKITKEDDRIQLICNDILTETSFAEQLASKQLCIKLDDRETDLARAILQLCQQHAGDTPLAFWLNQSKKYLIPRLSTGVNLSAAFYQALIQLVPASRCALTNQPRKRKQ